MRASTHNARMTETNTIQAGERTQAVGLITPKAQRQAAELIDTLRKMENAELDTIKGWDATPNLENIRHALDLVIEAQETINNHL